MKHSPQPASCNHVRIAHSDIGDVAVCPDCGIVHVSLQYVTMRFTPEAFRQLALMLGAAQGRIDNVSKVFHARSEGSDSANIDARVDGTLH